MADCRLACLMSHNSNFFNMENARFIPVSFVSLAATSATTYTRTFDKELGEFTKPLVDWYDDYGNLKRVYMKPPTFMNHADLLSVKAIRNIKRSVYTLLNGVDPEIMLNGKGTDKITFVTLTLPSLQMHDDKVIKSKCLNQLLGEFKTKYQMKNFVWRAENQKNGNIHFHLLVDCKIPHKELRSIWNRIINKLGYVDAYTEKMKTLTFEQYKYLRYGEKQISENQLFKLRSSFDLGCSIGWSSPNSTDIQRLSKVKNVVAYICKYISKAEEVEQPISGRVWQCSQAVSKAKRCVEYLTSKFTDELRQITESVKDDCIKIEEFTTTILYRFSDLKKHCKNLFDCYIENIQKHFNPLPELALSPLFTSEPPLNMDYQYSIDYE